MIALSWSVARTVMLVSAALILILVLLPAALVAAGPVLFVGGGPTADPKPIHVTRSQLQAGEFSRTMLRSSDCVRSCDGDRRSTGLLGAG